MQGGGRGAREAHARNDSTHAPEGKDWATSRWKSASVSSCAVPCEGPRGGRGRGSEDTSEPHTTVLCSGTACEHAMQEEHARTHQPGLRDGEHDAKLQLPHQIIAVAAGAAVGAEGAGRVCRSTARAQARSDATTAAAAATAPHCLRNARPPPAAAAAASSCALPKHARISSLALSPPPQAASAAASPTMALVHKLPWARRLVLSLGGGTCRQRGRAGPGVED